MCRFFLLTFTADFYKIDRMFLNNGLSFECQQCSVCCRHEPGAVFLRKGEAKKIAAFLEIDVRDFFNTFCRVLWSGEGERISLREKSNYDCIFWEAGGCRIYPVRPIQCSTYPFWPHILQSESTWKEESARCPGIGKGRCFSQDEIARQLEKQQGEFSNGSEF